MENVGCLDNRVRVSQKVIRESSRDMHPIKYVCLCSQQLASLLVAHILQSESQIVLNAFQRSVG